MTLNCVDLSNYSGPLSAAQVDGLKAVGVVLGIVQSLDPPPGYPVGVTRQQIQALLDGGIAVDAYIWLWFDLETDDIDRKCALLDGLPIRQLWLDVEDQSAVRYDEATIDAKIQVALEHCDQAPSTGGRKTGIYTGRWWWADKRFGSNTTVFRDRALWDSDYDGLDDTRAFLPYGGWTERAIKQYHGTTTLATVPNVDLNALSDDELALVVGSGDVTDPEREECERRLSSYESALGYLGGDVADMLEAESRRKPSVRRLQLRNIANEMRRVRAEPR